MGRVSTSVVIFNWISKHTSVIWRTELQCYLSRILVARRRLLRLLLGLFHRLSGGMKVG